MEKFEHGEHEANAQGTHHVHIPRGTDSRKIMAQINREAMGELERGQNVGVFGLLVSWNPVNTQK